MSKYGRGHKLTLEECQSRVRSISDNITVLEYTSAAIPVKCKCELCGNVWLEPSKNLYRGSNCPQCTKRKKDKWAPDDFFNKVSEVLPTVEVTGLFGRVKDRLHCRCLVCGREWESTGINLLQGHGCDACAHKYCASLRNKTHAQFVAELHEVDASIELLGEYRNAKAHIACRCKECGFEWKAQPTNLLQGYGCPQCGRKRFGEAHRKTQAEFISDLCARNPDISLISSYTASHDVVTLKCDLCGAEWMIQATSALNQACGCPVCHGSNGEKAIAAHLHDMGIMFDPQKRFDDLRGVGGGKLSYDFYVPDFGVLIEYQGQYHDGSANNQTSEQFEKQHAHDVLKRNYAKQNGYDLLEIWYYDFKKIRSILEQKFLSQPNQA